VEEVRVETPYGAPSDVLKIGGLGGRRVAFLARHGRDHTLLPTEINARANIFALKSIGVERAISVSAVGSMREGIRPRDVVFVDQFIDRTHHRDATFFGEGIVAHVTLADPVCADLRAALLAAGRGESATVHDGGTYVCIEGPAFSTRAESRLYRSWDVDVIGMTNMQEARLAREAEICYATMALVTDYDCWHEEEEDVSVEALLENLRANGELAARIVGSVARALPSGRTACNCGEALGAALLTPLDRIDPEAARRLGPILGRYLPETGDP